jgi:hypothetical protein
MATPTITVLWDLADGVQVGYRCVCGPCQPTASIFRDDPHYERHDPRLAEGPCCCGRFFVVGLDAASRAKAMARERQQTSEVPAYSFRVQAVSLPWGGAFPAVVADLRE